MVSLREIFEAEKTLEVGVQWRTSDPNWNQFAAPVTVLQFPAARVLLRGKSAKNYVDRAILLQLELLTDTRTNIQLSRAEWRPLTTHNNRNVGPEHLRFVDQDWSHIHRFEDNYVEADDRMRANLQISRPIEPDPPTVRDFLDEVGNCFTINNMWMVPPPPAQAVLL